MCAKLISRQHELDFARCEPYHALPRIFRIFGRGERGGQWEEVYTVEDGSLTIKFEGTVELGINDENVFLGIVALGGSGSAMQITSMPKQQINVQLRRLLDPVGESVEIMCKVSTSQRALMRASGYSSTGAKMWRQIEEGLHRMYKTTVWVRENETGWAYPMPLIAFAVNDQTGKLLVGLNQRLSSAIFGARWITISLSERHQIDGDTGKALHRWISAWLKPGSTHTIGMNALMNHVFGDDEVTHATTYKRKRMIEDGLSQISQLAGWGIRYDEKRKIYVISRPKLKK